jgi:hypothetical protein
MHAFSVQHDPSLSSSLREKAGLLLTKAWCARVVRVDGAFALVAAAERREVGRVGEVKLNLSKLANKVKHASLKISKTYAGPNAVDRLLMKDLTRRHAPIHRPNGAAETAGWHDVNV